LEWVYFVGHLKSESNENIGYELSFFRSKINNTEFYPVHFAITLPKRNLHLQSQFATTDTGKIGTFNSELIRSGDFQCKFLKDGGFEIIAEPRMDPISIRLKLIPKSPPLIHGNNGISKKSRIHNDVFSNYYSIPRLSTTGDLEIKGEKISILSGNSWMDHEWSGDSSKSSSIVSKDNSWDWVSIMLEDGSDLVVFNYQHSNKDPKETFGTYRSKEGKVWNLDQMGDVKFYDIGDPWKSNKTGKKYPLQWVVEIPSLKIKISIHTLMEDQEMDTRQSTLNVYWEGMVEALVLIDSQKQKGIGYLELKGR
jgi:predicted secreted hydrolase